MTKKRWVYKTILILILVSVIHHYLSSRMKNRRCKKERQKQLIIEVQQENLSFEEALMMERSNHVKNICQKLQAPSKDFCSFHSKHRIYNQAITGSSHLQDPNTGTIYCFNHKVASSTWMSLFARMLSSSQNIQNIIESEQYYKVKV